MADSTAKGTPAPNPEQQLTALERTLGLFTEVRAGEGATALILAANVFLLLCGYYMIKPVREALILALDGGAQYKSYVSGLIALILLVAVPVYARFAERVQRQRLLISVTLFFATHLMLFYLWIQTEVGAAALAIVFYVWVGMFSLMVVTQFWAFANDLYTEEQGRRLFPLVAAGASIGAGFGSLVLTNAVTPDVQFAMLPAGATLLCVSAGLFYWAHTREGGNRSLKDNPSTASDKSTPDLNGSFALVMQHRYLKLLAAFSLLFTVVNTNGEYMLGALIKQAAESAVAKGEIEPGEIRYFIGKAYGEFFLYVNIAGVILQSFVVSRIIRYGGVRLGFLVFPVIVLGTSVATAVVPVLAVLRLGKMVENSTDYSLNNTMRQVLWLPTTREMKYKAKQAVDTFFIRMGDVTSAGVVWLVAGTLSLGVRTFAILDVVLVVLWLWLARSILKEHDALHRQAEVKTEPTTSPT